MENDDIEVIQINIHGEDKPGLTSSLTDILARYDAAILDIGQANIHQTLSMGILFKTDSIRSGDIMRICCSRLTSSAFRYAFSRSPSSSTNSGSACRARTVISLPCLVVS